MGEVVNIPLVTRRIRPATPDGAPGLTVNLDALGKLGALLCQIAALEPVSSLADGQTAELARDGARVRVVGDQAATVAEELMDAKDELIAMLGDAGPRMLGACLDTLRRVYDDC